MTENTNPAAYYVHEHDYSHDLAPPRWIFLRETIDFCRDCEYSVLGFRPEHIQ